MPRPSTQTKAKHPNNHFALDGADLSSLQDSEEDNLGLQVGESGFILGQSIVPDKSPLEAPDIGDPYGDYNSIEDPVEVDSPTFRKGSFD